MNTLGTGKLVSKVFLFTYFGKEDKMEPVKITALELLHETMIEIQSTNITRGVKPVIIERWARQLEEVYQELALKK